ncbi:YibE/F family protein [Planomonospora sp. ID67723]|uniref:YibE/F family protein n=1 Tax=Planomonospora sp. ID67723 TaxID=2738134 RepID=UPI0018C37623|nr:YibE/F family protein [Planomonospora sp. ID67723]MBG0830154.1 YibE/F family protein [Planomonospora sp. ID67723]
MGANHSHGPAIPRSRATVWATLAVIVPLAIATLVTLVWMWPTEPVSTAEQPKLQRVTGTITSITLTPCPEEPPLEGAPPTAPPPSDPATCGDAKVELTDGAQAGERVTSPLPSGPGAQRFSAGDDVVLIHTPDSTLDVPPYQISDHDRSSPLLLVGAAFALAVIAFGRWRGVTALVGLAITFVLLLMFVIPAILAGQPPLLVGIVGSVAIMLSVLYLTHGFTVTTSVAIVGTVVSLSLTGALSFVGIGIADLSGITDESSFYLDNSYRINTQGLLLASIIIGSLGVLDDVTVTQAATVAELAHANPGYGFAQLYRAAARVGRSHIASVINTIILAYAGASLPLLLLISVGEEPVGQVVTNPVLAQEIVRSVAGTLGLIAAVPITTALAALAGARGGSTDHDHSPRRARHRRPPDVLSDPVS